MSEHYKKQITQILIDTFETIHAIFGLKVVTRTKNGKLKISTVQRIISLIWFGFYIVCMVLCEPIKLAVDLNIKNSLILNVLPRISGAIADFSFIFIYILTNVFADKRKRIIEEVNMLRPDLNRKSVKENMKGHSYTIIIGLLQIAYSIYYIINQQQAKHPLSKFALIQAILRKLVSACFFIEYVSAVIILLQQFHILNRKLKQIQKESLESKNYPRNERVFHKNLMEIIEQHKSLCKIGVKMNDVYSFQLLLNIAVLYILIITSSYVGLYALITVFTEEGKVFFIVTSFLFLMFYALTLLIIVEVTVQLCTEIESSKIILMGIRISSNHDEAINTIIAAGFCLSRSKLEVWAFKLFKIDYSLVFTVVASTSAYLFLMIQFELDYNK